MSSGRAQAATAPKTRSDRGAATRELILSTSTELFAQHGYAATTMRQLAERANLPLSAVYYYFAGKYDLLLAVMDVAMTRLEARSEGVAEGEADPVSKLGDLVEHHVKVHLAEPDAARVPDRELRALEAPERESMIARRDRYEERFRRVLAEGIESGAFSSALRIPIASAAIITMSTAVIDWWNPEGPLSPEQTAVVLAEYAVSVAAGSHIGTRAPSHG